MTVREIILFTALVGSIFLNCYQFATIRMSEEIIKSTQDALRKYVDSHKGGGDGG